MKIYKCENCGRLFTEEEMEEREICLENEYDVGSMFCDKHYQRVGCCPSCSDYEMHEMGTYELLEEIEDLQYEIAKLRKELKNAKLQGKINNER